MATSSLTLQLLAWVADRPRTMEAWRTTCPRLTIWEDAVSDGLLAVEEAGAMRDARVTLTDAGRALIGAQPARQSGLEGGIVHL